MQSRDLSYKGIILERLVEVDTKACFEDFRDIDVPPCKNTKPIFDMPLWDLINNQHLYIPTKLGLDFYCKTVQDLLCH